GDGELVGAGGEIGHEGVSGGLVGGHGDRVLRQAVNLERHDRPASQRGSAAGKYIEKVSPGLRDVDVLGDVAVGPQEPAAGTRTAAGVDGHVLDLDRAVGWQVELLGGVATGAIGGERLGAVPIAGLVNPVKVVPRQSYDRVGGVTPQ